MVAGIDYIPEDKRSNIQLECREVIVEDIRGREEDFTLEKYSFEYVNLKHEFPLHDATLRSYIVTTSFQLKSRFGAEKVICYDSLVGVTFRPYAACLMMPVPEELPSRARTEGGI